MRKKKKQKCRHGYREQASGCHKGKESGDEWNKWGKLATNFQLQNKWFSGMRCIA